MAAFLARQNFWKIVVTILQRYPTGQKFRRNHSILHGFQDTGIFVFCNFCESKILTKSLYLTRFSRCKHFCVCTIFAKTSKIQNGCHLWRDNFFFFLKIEIIILQIYPMGQKFRRNLSISHGFQNTGIFVFCNFCESKTKSLYLTVFKMQAFLCFTIFAKTSKIQNGRYFWTDK